MEVHKETIKALASVITGDSGKSPYKSGPKLVDFFNDFSEKYSKTTSWVDNYQIDFNGRSRWQYAEDKLFELNKTDDMYHIIALALDPRYYLNSPCTDEEAATYLNEYLKHDGFEVFKDNLYYKVRAINSKNNINAPFLENLSVDGDSHAFILEQHNKCGSKLENRDYDGAITNARSMVEAVFRYILQQSIVSIPDTEKDLNKLYGEIKKLLNLEAKEQNIQLFQQTLSGLSSIVIGIGNISSEMGDRHARKYKPEKRHARLVINTAYALCEFLIETTEKKTAHKKA